VVDPNELRIQDYRTHIQEQTQKLAAEERELTQTKQALGVRPSETSSAASSRPWGYPPSATAAEPEPARSWVELDRQKREYQALFASNIALSYRPSLSRVAPDAAPVSSTASEPSRTSLRPGAPPSDNGLGAGTPEYRLFEGTAIETVLTNRLDSTFSGPVNCMVTTNVYSHEGERLLIPQGTRILGEVRKLGGFGEQRLAVFFHRMIMPDGFSVNLDKFQGLDQIGETGLRDEVNHHYVQIFGVSLAIGAFAGLAQANTRYSVDESGAAAYEQGVTNSLSQSALHILDRYLNVLPTFTIREGYRVKVYLSQDLMLPAYDQHPVRNDL
jgi:type IV secretion system protein VirB10